MNVLNIVIKATKQFTWDCSKKMTVWHVCPLKTPLKWCPECRWDLDLSFPAAFAGLGIWQCQVGSGWQFLVQQFPFVLTPDPHVSSEHSKPRVSPCPYSPVTSWGWTLGRDLIFTVFSYCFLKGRWKRSLVWGSCKVSHVCINRSAEVDKLQQKCLRGRRAALVKWAELWSLAGLAAAMGTCTSVLPPPNCPSSADSFDIVINTF